MTGRFASQLLGGCWRVIDYQRGAITVAQYATAQPAWEHAERNNAVLDDRDPRPYILPTHRPRRVTMKPAAPRHDPADFTHLPEEHFGLLEEVVIRHTGAAPREAQRTANAVIRQARIRPPGDGPLFIPKALARLDEARYAEMEATVIRRTGLDPQAARDLVDGILGPLMITPPMTNGLDYLHHPGSGSCAHVYYGFDGAFRQCVVDHREPGSDMTLHGKPGIEDGAVWRTGDRRDLNVEEFQW